MISSFRHIPLLFVLLLSLVFVSCEDFVIRDIPAEAAPDLVVEAILTNELRFQEIKLSQVYQERNGEVPRVSGASVLVGTNGIAYEFSEVPDQSGIYRSKIPFAVIDNLIYHLQIEWEGKTYEATSKLSEVGPLPEITFRRLGRTDNYTFGDFVPILNANQQAMYEVYVNWSHLTNDSTSQALTYFYTFSSIHVNELIRPEKEQIIFPEGSIVIVRKYGLNDDFADFLFSMAIETEWDGKFYFALSENLPTNISNDAWGFFSTCAVVTDTLVVQ
ncbi:MAG: DUF4249 family protein [Bacteroidia bacterium]